MVETLNQKGEWHVPPTILSNPSGILFLREEQGRTGGLEHVASQRVGNAGSSKQGHTCMMTEIWYYSTYGCNGSCRPLLWYRQIGEAQGTVVKPILSGRKQISGPWETLRRKVECAEA